jgi:hypothetical protein
MQLKVIATCSAELYFPLTAFAARRRHALQGDPHAAFPYRSIVPNNAVFGSVTEIRQLSIVS